MFNPYKRIILFPEILEGGEIIQILLVEYHSPGRFKVLCKLGESRSYQHARRLAWYHAQLTKRVQHAIP